MNTRERPEVRGLGRRGAIMMMTAGFALVLISMTAMVTDVGYMYYSQAKLQTAVNAGWKAGYDKMIELTGTKTELDEPTKEIVRRHVKSVLSANGFGQDDLKSIDIIIGENNDIKVVSRKEVGLFFARVMNIDSAEVAAGRQNTPDSKLKVVPFGIPHGVVRDVSKNVYTWDEFDENEGFKKDEEYILKLGEG
ncbi:MAG TPA: pilus assembly protein TadG-related protein, partial [Lentimicrobium sp.]|nr:pilus assembly protein TadG-related protein [Lentimicrobium sp.]